MASGKPIETVITTDVSDVVSGAEKVADSFDNVQDSLKDTAKASEKASKGIQDDTKDAAKVIDRDLTKALDEAADASKTSGKSIGKNVKDGTDKAGEGMSELRDEANSTAKEAAASFGDITDAADALQEVLANALVGFGPAGAAVGIAAAIGVGLLTSALQDNADQINENKEKMLSLAGEIRDVGGDLSKVDFVGKMQDWGLAIQDTKEWWELWQDDAKSGFDMVQEESRKAGTSWEAAFKGAHGTMDDSIKFLKDTEGQIKSLDQEISDAGATYDEYGRAQSNASMETQNQRDALVKQREAAQKNADATRDATKAAWDAVNVGKTQNSVLQEQLTLTNDLADTKKDAITSELDLADAQEETRQKLADSTAVYQDHTKASRDNERSIIDSVTAINDWGQAQVDSGADVAATNATMAAQREQLVDSATKFFGSKAAAEAYIASLEKTPKKIDTDVNVNGIPDAEEKVRAFIDKPGRHIFVDVKTGDTSAIDNYITGMNGGKVYVDVVPRNGWGLKS